MKCGNTTLKSGWLSPCPRGREVTRRGTRRSSAGLQCRVPCSGSAGPVCCENSRSCTLASLRRGCEDGGEDTGSLKRYFWASPLVIELWPPWRGAGPPMAQRVIQKDHRKAKRRRRWHNYRAISGQLSRLPGAHLQMLGLPSHHTLLVEGEAGPLLLPALLLRCPGYLLDSTPAPSPRVCLSTSPLDWTPH